MESTFSQAVAAWQPFYALLGGAAATLMGLLFVAVALHAEQFTGKGSPVLGAVALQTFASFLYLLAVAFVFLVPHAAPLHLFGWLSLITMLALVTHGSQMRGRQGLVYRTVGAAYMLSRIIGPALCYIGVVVVAVTLLQGDTGGLEWLLPIFLALLANATRRAWDLLVQVGEDKRAARPAEGDPQLRRLEQQLREVTRRQRQITRRQEEVARTGEGPPRRRG